MKELTTVPCIQLDYSQDGSVVVTPKDQDRFVLSVKEATSALSDAAQLLKYGRQFGQLMPRLTDWLQAQRENVRKAFVTVRDGALLFLVVRNQAKCDPAFTDALAELDMAIAQNESFDVIKLDVLALPDVSDDGVQSFLTPSRHKELASAD